MTTSYLFAYYTLDIQVLLSSSMIIKTGFFSFCVSVESLLRFLVFYINHSNVIESLQKNGRNKEQIKKNIP